MQTVNAKFFSAGFVLALISALVLTFAGASQAQTPADDQYGSPTGSSAAGSPEGSAPGVEGDESGNATGGTEGISGDVLPSTGGAPIYLVLAGTILLATGTTLWLRFRAE